MMKHKLIAAALCTAMVLTAVGCGKGKETVQVTPTPAPTATPTPVPATPTPMPTSTPAPRRIGVKTDDAKFVSLTNSTGKELRGIYLKTSGNEDWGRNLIPAESSVKASEQVEMYYTPAQEEDAVYDMQIVISDDEVYEIYSADLADMEKASLNLEEDMAYLRYMSLSSKKETNTKNNQADTSSDEESSDVYYGSDDDNQEYDDYYGSDDDNEDYDQNYDDEDNTDYDDEDDTDGTGDGDDDGDYDNGDGDYDNGDGDYDDGDDDEGGDIVWDENGNWSEG